MATVNETANTYYNQASAANKPWEGLDQTVRNAGLIGPNAYRTAGAKLQTQGYANLLDMLQSQGRMDPRILARQQALNSLQTQRQQNAAAGGMGGFGGGGLNQALQAAIANAGINRDQNLRYQDIADSYARNQQNLGILNENVIQPGLQYAGVGNSNSQASKNRRSQDTSGVVAGVGKLIGSFL